MWNKAYKMLKGWKTFLLNTFSIWLSGILWVLPDIIAFANGANIGPLLSSQYAPYVVLVLGLLNLLVRKFTDGSPGAWAGKHSESDNDPNS